MISFKHYSDLYDYLKGKLSGQEALRMEETLRVDKDLAKTAADLTMIDELFTDYKLLDIEAMAAESYEGYKKTQRVKKWAWAAGITAALIAGAVIYFTQTTTDAPTIEKEQQEHIPEPSLQKTEEMNQEHNTVPTTIESTEESMEEASTTAPSPTLSTHEESAAVIIDSASNLPTVNKKELVEEKETPTKEEQTALAEDPCLKHSPEINLHTAPTCSGEKQGSVQVLVNEGRAPYDIQIYDEPKAQRFEQNNLAEGLYTAAVTDKNGCYNELVFEITSKLCPQDMELNPTMDKKLTFNYTNARLSVHSPAGKVYFEKTFTDRISWNGQSQDGQIVPGYYIYNIEKDGKQLQFGSITILE